MSKQVFVRCTETELAPCFYCANTHLFGYKCDCNCHPAESLDATEVERWQLAYRNVVNAVRLAKQTGDAEGALRVIAAAVGEQP